MSLRATQSRSGIVGGGSTIDRWMNNFTTQIFLTPTRCARSEGVRASKTWIDSNSI
jgi:hypothetical protein